jgi:hypothetical protein
MEIEVEQIRRIKIAGITYEQSTSSESGEDIITIIADGADPIQLSGDHVDQLSRFFSRVVRGNAARARNPNVATDGRGQVNHPERDARLKGNEDLRQGDPGGAKRAGHA